MVPDPPPDFCTFCAVLESNVWVKHCPIPSRKKPREGANRERERVQQPSTTPQPAAALYIQHNHKSPDKSEAGGLSLSRPVALLREDP